MPNIMKISIVASYKAVNVINLNFPIFYHKFDGTLLQLQISCLRSTSVFVKNGFGDSQVNVSIESYLRPFGVSNTNYT